MSENEIKCVHCGRKMPYVLMLGNKVITQPPEPSEFEKSFRDSMFGNCSDTKAGGFAAAYSDGWQTCREKFLERAAKDFSEFVIKKDAGEFEHWFMVDLQMIKKIAAELDAKKTNEQ